MLWERELKDIRGEKVKRRRENEKGEEDVSRF